MPAIISLTISAAAPSGRVLWDLAGRVRRGLKQLAEKVKNRHDAMRLAELDDRMLSDIGLNRSDLRDAYALPLWRDPSDVLARRAAERRGTRQRPTPTNFTQPRRPTRPSKPRRLCKS